MACFWINEVIWTFKVSRVVGPDSYQMGIIDFQQEWNFAKKFERFVKVYIYGQDAYGLSAIEPEIYRDRLVHPRYPTNILRLRRASGS